MNNNSITKCFPRHLEKLFIKMDKHIFNNLEEIRLRINKPLIVTYKNDEYFIDVKSNIHNCEQDAYIVTSDDVQVVMEMISEYSLYAFIEQIKNGFITIFGGHRIGICGNLTIDEGGIKNIKYISSFNIRIAHNIIGCGDVLIPYITYENEILNTLIISPPAYGKTTLLRDITRKLSTGFDNIKGKNVSLIDERSEIAACYKGIAQNDVGLRTDIFDNSPKHLSILMALRSMSPSLIVVDEIGSSDDISALNQAFNSGVSVIATIHGKNIDEIKFKYNMKNLLTEKAFKRYVVLEKKAIKTIYNENFEVIYDN